MRKNIILLTTLICLSTLFGSNALAQQQERVAGTISLSLPSPAQNAYVTISNSTSESSTVVCFKGTIPRGTSLNIRSCSLETMPEYFKITISLDNQHVPIGVGYLYTLVSQPGTESCDFNLDIKDENPMSKPEGKSTNCRVEQ